MLNIVIPMAGAGSRFANEGFSDPKPLIRLHGVPMIRVVVENIRPSEDCRFIFVCQRAHENAHNLVEMLETWVPGSSVVLVDGLTDGAACTVLSARSLIDNDEELMIANSDQFIDLDINRYLKSMRDRDLDGQIMTMRASDPKWSFVELSDDGLVRNVVEKVVVSDEATTGIYNFRRGADFVRAAESMINQGLLVNNEFYIAPTYNQLIREGLAIGFFNVGCEGNGMYGLGTPTDLRKFLELEISRKCLIKAA